MITVFIALIDATKVQEIQKELKVKDDGVNKIHDNVLKH